MRPIAAQDDTGTISPLDNRPLTERVRGALLSAIRSGAFPDDRLPPEDDLAVQLGVSRTTLRAALQSLEADGVISRRRRHGTFVNVHLLRRSMPLNRLVAFTTLIEQCGHTASADPQTHRVAPAGQEAAEKLQVEPQAPCLLVDRLLRADGDPVIALEDVVPLDRLSVGPDAVVLADSTFAFLERNGAAPVDYATTEILPRVAAEGLPAGLAVTPGTPYIELLEVHFTRDHDRVALSRISVDDSLVRFSVLRRGL